MLNAFALNSHINNDPKYDDDFFLVMDHAIDQGFAFGHGNGTNHHYGYNIRKIYDAMWLMRDKIAARGKTDEYVKVLAYWSGLADSRRAPSAASSPTARPSTTAASTPPTRPARSP